MQPTRSETENLSSAHESESALSKRSHHAWNSIIDGTPLNSTAHLQSPIQARLNQSLVANMALPACPATAVYPNAAGSTTATGRAASSAAAAARRSHTSAAS